MILIQIWLQLKLFQKLSSLTNIQESLSQNQQFWLHLKKKLIKKRGRTLLIMLKKLQKKQQNIKKAQFKQKMKKRLTIASLTPQWVLTKKTLPHTPQLYKASTTDYTCAFLLFQTFVINYTASAARKVDKKVANPLLKVAQKVANIKNKFKTNLKLV